MEDVRELLRQVLEGADFASPAKLVQPVKAEAACKVLPGLPYSIATNVAHTEIWNRVWLNRLQGLAKVNPFPDFPIVEPFEWPAIKDSFLQGLETAKYIAFADPFVHACRTDPAAKRLITKIAIHTSYHLGQIALLKRALRTPNR